MPAPSGVGRWLAAPVRFRRRRRHRVGGGSHPVGGGSSSRPAERAPAPTAAWSWPGAAGLLRLLPAAGTAHPSSCSSRSGSPRLQWLFFRCSLAVRRPLLSSQVLLSS
ncbi:Os07g0463900 [Oryza sativa Japonica Group]|uniref:Os07g0463900 protein n=1 Tax=Oryza sativa subsp. japonica TaxID=39947 RepID=A0A0P0X5T3_ORYSJ|nr:Os07g0463900 [Oryza sativa Japonica Group]